MSRHQSRLSEALHAEVVDETFLLQTLNSLSYHFITGFYIPIETTESHELVVQFENTALS